jgi:DNA-binding NarL/FixJ family response regulator
MKYCIVGECADGLAAASLIASLKPDIAILKLNLPELHGTEVIRRTRQAGIETRFLALAEHRDSRAGKDALRAGADGCLLTYDSADCLLEALQRILNGNVFVSPNLGVRACCPQDPLASLSVREHQVFSLLVSGLRPKQIANHLDLSLKTVDTYRANLMKKLEIYNLPGLVKLAIQRNLTSLA